MFQKLIDILYRHPNSKLKYYNRFGGIINYQKMQIEKMRMKRASLKLNPSNSYPDGYAIYFLTGKKYLYQTLFCIQSLSKVSSIKLKYILVDDGSFDSEIKNNIDELLPGATILSQTEINKSIKQKLSKEAYLTLVNKIRVYPHLKKIVDIHCSQGNDWKLVMDSDMLFWKEPKAIIDWLKEPNKPICLKDSNHSYGYSKKLMDELSHADTKPLINVGVIGLCSSKINWNNLAHWVIKLEEKEGKSYFLEQAITAMLIGDEDFISLNEEEYIVNPKHTILEENNAVLHHYVDLSKEKYFKEQWKKI